MVLARAKRERTRACAKSLQRRFVFATVERITRPRLNEGRHKRLENYIEAKELHMKGILARRRKGWRRDIDESKIDMGLMAPLAPEALEYSLYLAVMDNDYRAIAKMAAEGFIAKGGNPDMWADGKLGEPSGPLLHFAVRHATLKTVIALLNLGADPFARDAAGVLPRDAALERPTGNRMRTVLELWERKKTPSAIAAPKMQPQPRSAHDDSSAQTDKRRTS